MLSVVRSMPKTPSVVLREKLRLHNLELLDIYQFKDKDIIRYKDRGTNKVYLYFSGKRVRDLVDPKELDILVSELVKHARSSQ